MIRKRYVENLEEDCLDKYAETVELEYSLDTFLRHNHSLKILQNIICHKIGKWKVGTIREKNGLVFRLDKNNDNIGEYFLEVDFKDYKHKINVYYR